MIREKDKKKVKKDKKEKKNTCAEVSFKTSNIGKSVKGQFLNEVIFKKVTSSAPSSKYLFASSTGFPKFRTFPSCLTSYWSPFVTTKSPCSFPLTSKQAMTLLQSWVDVFVLGINGDESRVCSSSNMNFLINFNPICEDFSGWNWTPMILSFSTTLTNSNSS